MFVIDEVCKVLGMWWLEGVIFYVIFEFCLMCVGVVVFLWVEKVVFGVFDFKGGCLGMIMNFL